MEEASGKLPSPPSLDGSCCSSAMLGPAGTTLEPRVKELCRLGDRDPSPPAPETRMPTADKDSARATTAGRCKLELSERLTLTSPLPPSGDKGDKAPLLVGERTLPL